MDSTLAGLRLLSCLALARQQGRRLDACTRCCDLGGTARLISAHMAGGSLNLTLLTRLETAPLPQPPYMEPPHLRDTLLRSSCVSGVGTLWVEVPTGGLAAGAPSNRVRDMLSTCWSLCWAARHTRG